MIRTLQKSVQGMRLELKQLNKDRIKAIRENDWHKSEILTAKIAKLKLIINELEA